MKNYDYILATRELCTMLHAHGYTDDAREIELSINCASTGIELVMGVNYNVGILMKKKLDMKINMVARDLFDNLEKIIVR